MSERYLSAGRYRYAFLRVGMVIQSPAGNEIYIQPGDDENAMRENIAALDEIDDEKLLAHCADILFGEYF